MKILRIVAILFAVYVGLGLTIDAAIGYFQPQSEGTAVLRSFDAAGNAQETVLGLLQDDDTLWVESGHWFRGWYNRVLEHPDVELVRAGQSGAYRAVPVDTPEAVERVKELMGKGSGAGYYVGRTMLLWAPIKPIRLDPRTEKS